jgi:hypothetical protein
MGALAVYEHVECTVVVTDCFGLVADTSRVPTVRTLPRSWSEGPPITRRRIKEALAVARSRGVRLGNPHGAAALRRAGRGAAALREAIARNADRHAEDVAPVAADIRAGGATSFRAIAGELNARGMLTRGGGRWHVSTVTNLLDRLGVGEATCASRG